MGTKGKREFVWVLRLMEDFPHPEVHQAVSEALRLGAIGFDAVKHLLGVFLAYGSKSGRIQPRSGQRWGGLQGTAPLRLGTGIAAARVGAGSWTSAAGAAQHHRP